MEWFQEHVDWDGNIERDSDGLLDTDPEKDIVTDRPLVD